jgi:hypothetical protein
MDIRPRAKILKGGSRLLSAKIQGLEPSLTRGLADSWRIIPKHGKSG